MNDFDNRDDKTDDRAYEEKKENFLNVLKLMAAVGARNSELNAEEQVKEASFHIGKMLYITYSGMLAAGFNEEQALDLTKCMVFGSNANDALKK